MTVSFITDLLPPVRKTEDDPIIILRCLLPSQLNYFHQIYEGPTGNSHKLCYMGQILHNLGHTTVTKYGPTREFSELRLQVDPFSCYCRGNIVQTDLATRIMNLKPSQHAERRLTELLEPYHKVQFHDR
jgi:hypothetical protein